MINRYGGQLYPDDDRLHRSEELEVPETERQLAESRNAVASQWPPGHHRTDAPQRYQPVVDAQVAGDDIVAGVEQPA
jgi:hypothetical protein